MIDLGELARLSPEELEQKARENPEWFEQVCQHVLLAQESDRQQAQLHYYAPTNPKARAVHLSTAREVSAVGGNRSGKTTTAMAELAIRMTGHIPESLIDDYPLEKIRGPIRARVVCNSFKDTLEPVIKPKLRWDAWNGPGDPGDGRGHWGFIPAHCLEGGTWERAYSEKYLTLSVTFCTTCVVMPHVTDGRPCRGCAAKLPLHPSGAGHTWPKKWKGKSQCQMMSYSQELSEFRGTSQHLIIHDELPPEDKYRENRMRTLDVKGQIITAFTPPDQIGEAQADVAWYFDAVYEPGLVPENRETFATFHLFTEENSVLPIEEIESRAKGLTEEQRQVRFEGKFIHLTGVIFKTFTDRPLWWCVRCVKRVLPIEGGACATCKGTDLIEYCHVIEPFEVPSKWPVVFVIDPHPRKPDAIGWFAVTPSDDVLMIGDAEAEGTAQDVARVITAWEESHHANIVKRLMDPNIAVETVDRMQRGWTLRDEYSRSGIRCDMACDQMNTGIHLVEEALRPDPKTRRPRFQVFNTCERTIKAMKRWSWGEWQRPGGKEPKEQVSDRHKDFADVCRYTFNERPTYHSLIMSTQWGHRAVSGRSSRGY